MGIMDLTNSGSNHSNHNSNSSSNPLYFYNVDAILSELVRPTTPKLGNLGRPRLVKPEPIRPQQLVVAVNSGLYPFIMDHRHEGARNPDPDDNDIDATMTEYGDNTTMMDTISDVSTLVSNDESYGMNHHTNKRHRDDDIYHYTHYGTPSTTTAMLSLQDQPMYPMYYPSTLLYGSSLPCSSTTNHHDQRVQSSSSSSLQHPHSIVYKSDEIQDVTTNHYKQSPYVNTTTTLLSSSVLALQHEQQQQYPCNNNNNNTIVKPKAMRPIDMVQYLNHPMTTTVHNNNTNNSPTDHHKHHTVVNESMQVIG